MTKKSDPKEKTLTVTEMSRNFSDYVNRVRYRRESFVLTKGNVPVAQMTPVPLGVTGEDLQGILSAGPHLDPEDIEQFASDIEDARKELSSLPTHDPWED